LNNKIYLYVGKIEKTDWNVKEIEKKIEENKMGRSVRHEREKVPKWSREQVGRKKCSIVLTFSHFFRCVYVSFSF